MSESEICFHLVKHQSTFQKIIIWTTKLNKIFFLHLHFRTSLSWLTQDAEVVVRLAYAESIASLAETALKFLEMAQLDHNNVIKENQDNTPIQYQVKQQKH
jgi:hypothetical protein